MTFTVAKFRDVADGLQPGQFQVGDHDEVGALSQLDPTYKRLMDEPITAVIAVTGGDGRPKAAEQMDKIWTKYTGNEPPYGLRDPSINERRVLFEASVDHVATFGRP